MLTHYGHFIGTFAKIMINQGMVHVFFPWVFPYVSPTKIIKNRRFGLGDDEWFHIHKRWKYPCGKRNFISTRKTHVDRQSQKSYPQAANIGDPTFIQYLDDVECLGNLGNHADVRRGNDKPSIFWWGWLTIAFQTLHDFEKAQTRLQIGNNPARCHIPSGYD
jgi:hypothetical protein